MGTKKLRRSADQRWIGGVCGGIALLGLGSIVLFYPAAWFLIPDARTP